MGKFPPGRKPVIEIFFLSSEKVLPEVQTCFGYLYLPVNNATAEEFNDFFDKAVLMSQNYFGMV